MGQPAEWWQDQATTTRSAVMPQTPSLNRQVEYLEIGDHVRVHTGDYVIEILSGDLGLRDLFGRRMVTFDAEIVDGPDRIGDTGQIMFGPVALVEVIEKDA